MAGPLTAVPAANRKHTREAPNENSGLFRKNERTEKKLNRQKRTRFTLVLYAILTAVILTPGPAAVTAWAAAMPAHSRTCPSLWDATAETVPIYTPTIHWEEAQRISDLAELEATYAAASAARAAKDAVPSPIAFVPWEERDSVFAQNIGRDSIIGTFSGPGIYQTVQWGFEQSITDDPAKICLWGYNGLPGERCHAVMLYDHNHQTGRIVASLPVGTQIILNCSWGTYTYQLVGSEIAENLPESIKKDLPKTISGRVGDTFAEYIGDFISPSHPNGCIFDAIHANIENNGELWFVTCWPLNQKITDQRLIIRFKSIDGPILENWGY